MGEQGKILMEDLKKKIYDYVFFSCEVTSEKYGENHIFDEDKSVKWNKDEVLRRNKIYYAEIDVIRSKKKELYTSLVETAKKYIMQEAGVTEEKATKIYQYLYEKHYLSDLPEEIDELLELFQ